MFGARLWVYGVLSFLASAPSVIAGNAFHCVQDTVAEDALIIAHPTDDIAIHSDGADRVCTFAVNGATPIGEPSEEATRPSWPEVIRLIEQGDVRMLVQRLTAAHVTDDAHIFEYRTTVENVLEGISPDILACFSALIQFGTPMQPPPLYVEGDYHTYVSTYENEILVACSVTPPGTFMEHSADVPVLLLRIQLNNKTDDLFVPQGAIE